MLKVYRLKKTIYYNANGRGFNRLRSGIKLEPDRTNYWCAKDDKKYILYTTKDNERYSASTEEKISKICNQKFYCTKIPDCFEEITIDKPYKVIVFKVSISKKGKKKTSKKEFIYETLEECFAHNNCLIYQRNAEFFDTLLGEIKDYVFIKNKNSY